MAASNNILLATGPRSFESDSGRVKIISSDAQQNSGGILLQTANAEEASGTLSLVAQKDFTLISGKSFTGIGGDVFLATRAGGISGSLSLKTGSSSLSTKGSRNIVLESGHSMMGNGGNILLNVGASLPNDGGHVVVKAGDSVSQDVNSVGGSSMVQSGSGSIGGNLLLKGALGNVNDGGNII